MHQNAAFRTIPDVPLELSTSPPRIIRLSEHVRHETKAFALMLGIAVIGFCWINIYAARQVYRGWVLRQQGAEVVLGEIIEIRELGIKSDYVRYHYCPVKSRTESVGWD